MEFKKTPNLPYTGARPLPLAHANSRDPQNKNVMIKFSSAALGYARQPGFSALLFSDVKPPDGQAAAYKQAAADDLLQMGLTVLTENIFYGKPTGRRSERTTMVVIAQYNDARRRRRRYNCRKAGRGKRTGRNGSATSTLMVEQHGGAALFPARSLFFCWSRV